VRQSPGQGQQLVGRREVSEQPPGRDVREHPRRDQPDQAREHEREYVIHHLLDEIEPLRRRHLRPHIEVRHRIDATQHSGSRFRWRLQQAQDADRDLRPHQERQDAASRPQRRPAAASVSTVRRKLLEHDGATRLSGRCESREELAPDGIAQDRLHVDEGTLARHDHGVRCARGGIVIRERDAHPTTDG
jgi:hypothetical protein